MKKTILAMTVALASTNVLAVDMCGRLKESITYDSATTFENSVTIVNPRLKMADAEAFIIAYNGYAQRKFYGTTFCKALGMRSGMVGDIRTKTSGDLAAEFNEKGTLLSVGTTTGDFVINVVTCLK